MRAVGALVLAACRFNFEETRLEDSFEPVDAAVDANLCGTPGADWADWTMPNDPGSGRPNPTSYTVTTGTTVTDEVTGLVWQRDVALSTYTYDEARAYCSNLALDGACWRLPHRIELVSLVNYSVANPAIDRTAFPATPNDQFWSASIAAGGPTTGWTVNFSAGHTAYVPLTEKHFVRCVRTTPPPTTNRYVPDAETVLDRETGLVWQRMLDPTGYTFAGAETYCSALAAAGGGWRIPSIQELLTLVDTSRANLLIDTSAFPGTPAGIFWTGSPLITVAGNGWTIDFTFGYAFRPIGSALNVRCVR